MTSILLQYLNEKKKKNAQYSLRSLAKGIDISPAQLSSIINKKKKLSPKHAIKIIERLNLTEQESLELLSDIDPELRNALSRKVELQMLSADEFELISNWVHYGILSLSYFKNNIASIDWISAKLSVPSDSVESAFRRLERLGIIKIVGNKFVQSTKPLTTTSDIPSESIKSHHRQNLELAKDKLEKVSVDKREYSSITFPMNIKDIKKAKTMINEFKQKLYMELKCENPSDVYTLSMQLFPLTNPSKVDVESDN